MGRRTSLQFGKHPLIRGYSRAFSMAGLILLSLIVTCCDGSALGPSPPDKNGAGAAAGGVSSSKSTTPVGNANKEAGQLYPDLRTIAGVAPKGRIQDKEYNPSIKAVDELIGMGVEAVPFLIQRLDDEKKVDHHVLDFWSYVTVGDLSLVILTDFFTAPSLTEHTIPGTSWSEILDVPSDADTTAEAQLRAFVSSKGRKAIRAKWEGIWQSYKDRLYWDETGRCFRAR